MHVLVLFNEPTLDANHPESAAERDVLEVQDQVAQALAPIAQVSRLGVNRDPRPLLEAIARHRPDLVFNLFEGTALEPELEIHVAALLEWLHQPYTGCPPRAMLLTQDKVLAKQVLRGAGLPTADWFAVEALPAPANPLGWPVILKAARQHASVGLDQGSVAAEPGQLAARASQLLARYGPPVVVERFLGGPEYNVAVVEDPVRRALPAAEIVFGYEEGLWPIVTYDAKWSTGSRDDLATVPRCPAAISTGLEARLRDLAERAFALFGCRDYARVDFRLDQAGEPFLLEINPNPDLHAGAGLARALAAAGQAHGDFIRALAAKHLPRAH